MSNDRIAIIGFIFALLATIVLALIVTQQAFPIFKPATSNQYVSITQDIGPEDGRFMWGSLSIQLIVQAFVIFAAAAGSLSMLRTEE